MQWSVRTASARAWMTLPAVVPCRPARTASLLIGVVVGALTAMPASGQAPPVLELRVQDSVALALQNNKTIQAAYLDRVVQQFDLRVAQDKFTPKAVVSTGVERDLANTYGAGTGSSAGSATADATASVAQALASGARLNLSAVRRTSRADGLDRVGSFGWSLSLVQPLLRGGGFEVGRASVTAAELGEQLNVQSLKSVVSDTLASVISAHRTYLRSVKALSIAGDSVARARQLLETNRTLIAAGRMAEIDLVQSEADLANQEFNLLSTQNNTDAARLALVRLLDIDIGTPVQPVDRMELPQIDVTPEQAKTLALENRPDFLSQRLAVQAAQLRLLLAENNRLPDLSLTATYGRTGRAAAGSDTSLAGGDTRNLSLALRWSMPLGDLSYEQAVVAAKIDLEKTELALVKLREVVEIDVQNALRNVDMSQRQVRLAERARTLAQRKFEVETEKLKVGRSSNFQLVSFQNDLVNAQYNELGAVINYLEAVTALERSMGILLDRWEVSLVRR